LRGPANIRIRKEVDPVTQELLAYELFGISARPRA
jgi:hypothetical protein